MNISDIKIGLRIKTNRDFSGVPKGTLGIIVEDYGTGITVAWDLPDQPYPFDKTPEEVAQMYAVRSNCPLRDGFDKKTELQWLDVEKK